MNETIIVCMVLLTIAIVAAIVYFILTLIQISKTTKKLEETIDKINVELDCVHKVSEGVLEVASFFPKAWVKIAATVLPAATAMIFRKKK